MKKLLYLLLKKDMIKKLSKKHGTQFVDDVMATFGMPTDTTNEYLNSLKQTQEITIKHRYCDDCGIEIKRGMACSVAKCEIFGKDLCDKCIGHEANTMGDYREVYCKKCWELGTEYRLKIEQLENEIENLSTEWHNRCRSKNGA